MHNIASPDSTDPGIERQIQTKGLTAPRVTPAHIMENIDSAHFFTGSQAVFGADPANSIPPALGLLTFCVLVLKNGFTVTGESACASPENFDAGIGRQIALENAKQKIWPLMGYQLKEQLFLESCDAAQLEALNPGGHPVHTIAMWRAGPCDTSNTNGYWDWVASQIRGEKL